MLFDESQPGPEPLDVLAGGGDPAPQIVVLALERPDPEPGLRKLGTAMAALSLPGSRPQLGLGPLAARAPRGELLLHGGEELLQLLEDDAISSFVW